MAAFRSDPTFKLDEIVHLIARTVGLEKSREVVLGATNLLGIMTAPNLSAEDARRLLDTLANVPGLVGAAARTTRKRLGLSMDGPEPMSGQSTSTMRQVDAPASAPASAPSTVRSRGAPTSDAPSQSPGSEPRRVTVASASYPQGSPGSVKTPPHTGAFGEPNSRRNDWTPSTPSVQPTHEAPPKTLSSENGGLDPRRSGSSEQAAPSSQTDPVGSEPAPRRQARAASHDAGAVEAAHRRFERAPDSRRGLSPSRSASEASDASTSAPQRLPRSELVALLSHSLGRERGDELVTAAARRLNIDAAAFNRDEALRILADLAATPGVVGVTAKFAKARCVLRFPA